MMGMGNVDYDRLNQQHTLDQLAAAVEDAKAQAALVVRLASAQAAWRHANAGREDGQHNGGWVGVCRHPACTTAREVLG